MKRRLFPLAMLGLLAAVASGCSSLADTGYKAGELGNGGFYFSCNDTASCSRYSNDAKKFPKAVSLGSSFQVRFVSETAPEGSHITFDDRSPERGVTINAHGEYISKGPNGLVALKAGYATVVSRDAANQVIDFISIRVAKPDALVVYAADDKSETPSRIETISLSKSERRTYRVFAEEKKQVLAGTLAVDWESSDNSIVDLESKTDGTATIVARAAGTAKLVALGGTFAQEISIEVKP